MGSKPDARSPYESVLHRDLLFAAARIGDSVNVTDDLRRRIARRQLAVYCDPKGAGRYRLLREQIEDALRALRNDQGDAAVEAALAETLSACREPAALARALDAIDWLNAHTPVVAAALAACADPGLRPRTRALLRQVQARLPADANGTAPIPTGWDAVADDAEPGCSMTWSIGSRRWKRRRPAQLRSIRTALGLSDALGSPSWPS